MNDNVSKTSNGMLPTYANKAYVDNSRQWFKTFLEHTDEKEKLGDLIKGFVKQAYNDGHFRGFNKILDIGCGAGKLVKEVAEAFDVLGGDGYAYECIEYNPNSAKKTDLMFIDNGIPGIVYHENAFNFNYASFSHKFDFILVSHAAYYASDMGAFIASLMGLRSKGGAIMLIHEDRNSPLNLLREAFGGPVNYKTEGEISKFFPGKSFTHIFHTFTTNIVFGKSLVNELQDGKEVKPLLEFIVHRPFEKLEDEGVAANFISAVDQIARECNDSIPIFSNVRVIASNELISSYVVEVLPHFDKGFGGNADIYFS